MSSEAGDADGAAHLDAFAVDVDATEAGADAVEAAGFRVTTPAGIEEEEAGPELMSREDFFGLFRSCFDLPALFPVLDVPELAIRQEELAAAREASDAVFAICEETAALRWLVTAGGDWTKRLAAILGFGFVKVQAVRAGRYARAQARAEELAATRPRSPRHKPGEELDPFDAGGEALDA